MRFAHFLLVATAALLSSSNAVSAASGDVTSTNAEVAAPALDTERLLRSHKYDGYKEEEEEEERTVPTPEQITRWTEKVNRWVKEGKTPAGIKNKLSGLSDTMSDKNKVKYKMFLAAWGRANPGQLRRI